jgi:HSP20 family protein
MEIIEQNKQALPAAQDRRDPVDALRSDINRAFEGLWRMFDLPVSNVQDVVLGGAVDLPRIDVRDADKEIEVTAELPGFEASDIDVNVAEGALTIRGEHKEERDTTEQGYLRQERRVGRVERVLPLPAGLDLDAAKATFRNGILTMVIPKSAEAEKGVKRISVHQG